MPNGFYDNGLDFTDLLRALVIESDDRIARSNKGEQVTVPTSVYRVEMASGRGPFNDEATEAKHREVYDNLARMCATVMADPDHNHEQMGVTEQGFKKAHGHAAYGVDSMTSLNLWFPRPAREYIKSLGGKIVHYEIPVGGYIFRVGQGEVIFSKPASRRVAEFDIVTEEGDHA